MIAKNITRTLFYHHLVLVCLFCWLLGSEPGLKTLYGLIKIVLPGELHIEDLEGRLLDSLTIDNLHYTHKQFSFYAKKITLESQPHTLLHNTFKIPTLLIEQASLETRQSTYRIQKANLSLEGKLNGKKLFLDCREFEGTYQSLPLAGTGQFLFLDKALIKADSQLMIGDVYLRFQTEKPQHIQWQAERSPYQALGSLSSTEQGLTCDFLIKENRHNTLEGQVKIPTFSLTSFWKDAKIAGSLQGKFSDFSLVYRLYPFISQINATINLQAHLSGSVKNPRCDLHLTLNNGGFSIPQQRTTISQLKTEIKGSIPGSLAILTTGRIGDSTFLGKGSFNPLSPEGNTFFELSGDHLRLYNTAYVYLIASPKVQITYQNKKIQIEGQVIIPEARITLPDETIHVIRSQDVVFVDPLPTPAIPLNILPKISFIIQENVRFKGRGLDANIGGKLLIERRSDGLYTGLGRLTIKEGKYRLPGAGATGYIHHGRLLFPVGTLLYNPLLDIRIIQKRIDLIEDNTEAGLYVQGSLQKPTYHLYSNQDLQNTEILSRLGFGAGEREGNHYEHQLLSQSAMLFNSTVNPLFGQLQTKLGLEEIGIQSRTIQRNFYTQTGNESMLVLGKSLSKRFYLQFLQGMLDPVSILRLKYFMTPKIAISLEKSNEGMGVDLSFCIEKD